MRLATRHSRILSNAVKDYVDSLTSSQLQHTGHGIFLSVVDDMCCPMRLGKLCLLFAGCCPNDSCAGRTDQLGKDKTNPASNGMDQNRFALLDVVGLFK